MRDQRPLAARPDVHVALHVELGDVCVDLEACQRLVVLVAASSYPRWPQPPAQASQALGPARCSS